MHLPNTLHLLHYFFLCALCVLWLEVFIFSALQNVSIHKDRKNRRINTGIFGNLLYFVIGQSRRFFFFSWRHYRNRFLQLLKLNLRRRSQHSKFARTFCILKLASKIPAVLVVNLRTNLRQIFVYRQISLSKSQIASRSNSTLLPFTLYLLPSLYLSASFNYLLSM